MDFVSIFENDFKVLLPEVFLVFALSFLLIYGSVYSTKIQGSRGSVVMGTTIGWLCVQVLFIAALLVMNGSFESTSLLYATLIHDDLTANIKFILLLGSVGCMVLSFNYLRVEGIRAFEYPLLLSFSVLAMLLLVASYDLISLYLALELQSLCLYVLASFKRGSAYSTEAGLKYFIVGAFSSGLLLFGCSLIYGFTGTTSYEELARLVSHTDMSSMGLWAGLIFVSVAILFKLTAAPFHMWAPDVYEGSPTASTLFFSAVPKMALFGVLLRLYYGAFYEIMVVWQNVIVFSALSSMFVAALAALYQRRIKRFLAFSSVGHVGYMLVSLSCGTLEGVQGVLLYLIIYMVMSLNIWAIVMCTRKKQVINGQTTFSGTMRYMDELRTIALENPYLAFTLTVAMFSMAGIPPLAGFCAKMYVFFAAMESSMYLLAIFGVLMSVIGAFYYLRWIKILYFDGPMNSPNILEFSTENMVKVDREKSIMLGCTTMFILFFFAYPGPILLLTHKMALAVCILLEVNN